MGRYIEYAGILFLAFAAGILAEIEREYTGDWF